MDCIRAAGFGMHTRLSKEPESVAASRSYLASNIGISESEK